MWHLLFNLLLIMLGVAIGIITMCIMQISKSADEEINTQN